MCRRERLPLYALQLEVSRTTLYINHIDRLTNIVSEAIATEER